MNGYQFEELKFLADIIGSDRPEITKCLEKAVRNPEAIPVYKNHFLRLLKNEGFSLHDLPLFSFNLPEEMDLDGIFAGNVIFGNQMTRSLCAPLDSFAGHTLVSGQTKIGKSTLVKSFVPQFVEKGMTVWIFDCENEYKSLLRKMGAKRILVLDAASDRDNFLEPPAGTSPEEWKGKWRNVLRELWIREGGINLIDEAFANLYGNSGVFEGGENYPTIVDVMNFLRSIQFKPGSRYSMYHESVINRFGGLYDNLRCLRCRKGYDVRSLIEGRKCVIFNTRGLPDDIRHFYINLKTLKAATFLENSPPGGIRLIMIIDEAHKLYNKEIARKYDLGEPMVFSNARTFAKRGIACIYLDQIPSALPSALFGNVNNRFVMRLSNGDCVRRIARSANLNTDQGNYIPLLPPRHCLLHSGEFPHTVLFEVPELHFEYVGDGEVKKHMEKILPSLEYVPIGERIEISTVEGNTLLPGQKKASGARPNRLWAEIAKLLAEIGWISLSDLAAHLGNLAPWHVRRNLAAMVKQDLIELCAISFGTRGNPRTYVVLCPKGAEFIGLKFDDVRLHGKGSMEHVILQNILAEAMKNAGKTVAIEHSANGKSVDIAEISPERAIAYELELAPAHEHVAENALRDIEAGYDEVVVITRNQAGQNEAKDRIYKTIGWDKLSRIKFKLLREFL